MGNLLVAIVSDWLHNLVEAPRRNVGHYGVFYGLTTSPISVLKPIPQVLCGNAIVGKALFACGGARC